jgi:glycerophosphoryl diester phosphodiesterase
MSYAFLDHPGPLPYAHRGGALEGLENTMPALEAAVALGYRYLETDARVTADGVLLAFHDDDLSHLRPAGDQRAAVVRGKTAAPAARSPSRGWRTCRHVPRFGPAQPRRQERRRVAPMIDVIRRTGALERVCVGAFTERRRRVRKALGPKPARSRWDRSRSPRRLAASFLPGGLGMPKVPGGAGAADAGADPGRDRASVRGSL